MSAAADAVDLDALLAHTTAAAREAAAFIRERTADRASLEWRAKSPADFVSDVDTGAEARIRARLAMHADGVPAIATFIGEESAPDARAGAGLSYVVDPLDGTTNFLHGFPWYAVSIAALVDGRLATGVVLNVATGELFQAVAGRGAWREGERLAVSTTTEPARALLGTGLPFKDDSHIVPYLASLPPILSATAGVRRAGSASLDLCDVACGRFDAFWELMLAPWDHAAGTLMVREAGGVVTDLAGVEAPVAATGIVAGGAWMHAWLLKRVGNRDQGTGNGSP